jgi:D-glycero-D-manno-heptose 1,7-bisphosphate phosphatase
LRAIFLDRDGVLNENRADYVKSRQEFVWLPGSLDALAALARHDAPILVITNQSMVGRGLVPAPALDDIHRRMCQEAHAHGGRIDAVYACLHAPVDACLCRKPLPGLLHRAARDHRIDLAASILIGDAYTDYRAAAAAQMRYIHVRTGRGTGDTTSVVAADPSVSVVADLLAAVPLILDFGERSAAVA